MSSKSEFHTYYVYYANGNDGPDVEALNEDHALSLAAIKLGFTCAAQCPALEGASAYRNYEAEQYADYYAEQKRGAA